MAAPKKTSPHTQEAIDLVWGIHPILEKLKTDPTQVREIIVLKNRSPGKVDEIIALAKQHNLHVKYEQHLPASVENQVHQGVVARVRLTNPLSIEELLVLLKKASTQPILLALDCIQDPHNLGAIIRSAAAAGVLAIIITKDRTAPLSGTVAKVSAGALSHMAICQVTNLAETLKRLQAEGVWIYGADRQYRQ